MATRETWAARVREWKRSRLTAAAYAEREGFNAGTLTWWSSTLGRATLATSVRIDGEALAQLLTGVSRDEKKRVPRLH
jgi:hypothetical protein